MGIRWIYVIILISTLKVTNAAPKAIREAIARHRAVVAKQSKDVLLAEAHLNDAQLLEQSKRQIVKRNIETTAKSTPYTAPASTDASQAFYGHGHTSANNSHSSSFLLLLYVVGIVCFVALATVASAVVVALKSKRTRRPLLFNNPLSVDDTAESFQYDSDSKESNELHKF